MCLSITCGSLRSYKEYNALIAGFPVYVIDVMVSPQIESGMLCKTLS